MRGEDHGAIRAGGDPAGRSPRVLLLIGPATYRATAFLTAAKRVGIEAVPGLDLPQPLADYWGVPLALDFSDPERSAARIVESAQQQPFDVVLALDDGATLLAARASQLLGLPHNEPGSALAARDKFVMREHLAAARVPTPAYRRWPIATEPALAAADRSTLYPCVVKPLRLSGSRGVIRANDGAEFIAAWERTKRLLIREGEHPTNGSMLVERYLPGVEVAVEGLLTGGSLRILAIFDKPDPLEGPFFEETIYVTPSRLPASVQTAIADRTAESAAALGLREGPVHAELRINDDGVWPIELAGRSIGGLCSSVLEFGAGISLEELILRHATGLPLPTGERAEGAAAVMMIPIPRAGVLRAVGGVEEARRVPGVTGVEITAKLNQPLVPLPEGASYLGFIFARAAEPAAAESALRAAHQCLDFSISATISLTPAPAEISAASFNGPRA